jgi:hypothetical protein
MAFVKCIVYNSLDDSSGANTATSWQTIAFYLSPVH